MNIVADERNLFDPCHIVSTLGAKHFCSTKLQILGLTLVSDTMGKLESEAVGHDIFQLK